MRAQQLFIRPTSVKIHLLNRPDYAGILIGYRFYHGLHDHVVKHEKLCFTVSRALNLNHKPITWNYVMYYIVRKHTRFLSRPDNCRYRTSLHCRRSLCMPTISYLATMLDLVTVEELGEWKFPEGAGVAWRVRLFVTLFAPTLYRSSIHLQSKMAESKTWFIESTVTK